MSQYDQLTVVKLREELSKRELPKVGLKATLIRRLLDDDWRSGVPEEEPLEDLDQQDVTQPSSEPDLESQSGSEASDESTPEDLYPAYVRNQLRYCLSNVRYAGSFTASRTCQRIVNPGIRVNGIGDITSPLTVQDAKAILKVGAQSPFGRGSATIIDKSFRNTVELNPDQFKLCNPAWSQEINRIVALLGEDLGFSDSPSGIRPNLYKMLLYEKDAMFKAHKDSEKSDGMFGTLIVCLPSEHQGGEVVLTHRGETVCFNTSEHSKYGQSHLAWYSDVLHEVKPVKSGYRLVLTYNLIRTDYQGPGSANAISDEKASLRSVLKEWKRRYKAGQLTSEKLLYILDHKYSEANLCLESLKGRDVILGRILKESCDKEDFLLLFANMTKTILDAQATNDGYGDPSEEEFHLENLVKATGESFLREAKMSEDEIVQCSPHDRMPDEITSKETGNEGVDATHFYHDAVAILLPAEAMLDFRLRHASPQSVLKWIGRLTDDVRKAPDAVDDRKTLEQICKREVKTFDERCASRESLWEADKIMSKVIRACTVLRNAPLLQQAVSGCAHRAPGAVIFEAVASSLHHLPFVDVEPCLNELSSCKTNFHEDIDVINHLRPPSQEGEFSSELESTYKKWRRKTIKNALGRITGFVWDDVSALVRVVMEEDSEMAIKHVLPQMQKHSTKTKILIPFLAHIADSSSKELSEEEAVSQGAASKDKKALRDTVNKMIDTLIPAVTSALRFSDFHPKKKEPEPYWNDCRFRELPKDKDTAFAKQVADLYCYCHTTGRNKDADLILAWLLTEAETASTTIFPAFIVPFLPAFRVALNKSGIPISKAEQTVSQHMVAEFLNRCVGSEPSKPTAWILSPLGPCYRPPDCKLCPELDRFLQDPLQEEREFKEINIHFHQRVSKRCYSDFAHQITKDESGREILRVTKNDKVHEEWEKRLNEVGGRMKWFRRCETLLGDRYEELMDMRAVKLTTASRNLKMKAP